VKRALGVGIVLVAVGLMLVAEIAESTAEALEARAVISMAEANRSLAIGQMIMAMVLAGVIFLTLGGLFLLWRRWMWYQAEDRKQDAIFDRNERERQRLIEQAQYDMGESIVVIRPGQERLPGNRVTSSGSIRIVPISGMRNDLADVFGQEEWGFKDE